MVTILALNLNDHGVTIPKNKEIAVLQFLSPQEEEDLIEFGPRLIALNKMKNGEILKEINQLLRVGKKQRRETTYSSAARLRKKSGFLRQKHVPIRKAYLHCSGKFSII